MNNRLFWTEALRYGAILGLMMGISHIFESYIFCFADMNMSARYGILLVEWVVVVVLFIRLLYKFTKRHSLHYSVREGFSFIRALSFILVVSMLAGVIVGVMHQLYLEIAGYENYVAGYMQRINEAVQLFADDVEKQQDVLVDMADKMREQPAPSMFDTIFSSLYNYLIIGGLLGFTMASMLKREPQENNV